jgi:hypothetical protein
MSRINRHQNQGRAITETSIWRPEYGPEGVTVQCREADVFSGFVRFS